MSHLIFTQNNPGKPMQQKERNHVMRVLKILQTNYKTGLSTLCPIGYSEQLLNLGVKHMKGRRCP